MATAKNTKEPSDGKRTKKTSTAKAAADEFEEISESISAEPGSFREGVKKGSTDARIAVRKALPAITDTASKSIYAACYYVSFGFTYAALFTGNMLPKNNVVVYGIQDGAKAASETVTRRQEEKATRAKTKDEFDDGVAQPA